MNIKRRERFGSGNIGQLIDRILGDTMMMLVNMRMAFHFLDKDMLKIITD